MKPQIKIYFIIKNFVLFLFFLLIVISCCEKKNISNQEKIKQTILTLERQALDGWAKGVPADFCKNFAVDATYFDDIGAHVRLDSIEEIKSYFKSLDGKIPQHKYELEDTKVQVYGDIAILTLHYHSFTLDNESGIIWKATSVYKFNKDKWQVIHANWTKVKK